MYTYVPPWRRALKGAVAALTAIATLAVGLITTDTATATPPYHSDAQHADSVHAAYVSPSSANSAGWKSPSCRFTWEIWTPVCFRLSDGRFGGSCASGFPFVFLPALTARGWVARHAAWDSLRSSRLRRIFDAIRATLTCSGCVRIHRINASRGAVSRGVHGHPSSIAMRARSLRPFNPRPPMTPHRSWLTMPVAMHSACIGQWSQIAIAVRTIARRVATSAAESVPHIMSCIRGSRP